MSQQHLVEERVAYLNEVLVDMLLPFNLAAHTSKNTLLFWPSTSLPQFPDPALY